MSSKMMVFTGNANPELAQKVASRLYLSLGKADVGKFSDGEVAVELNENVRVESVEITEVDGDRATANAIYTQKHNKGEQQEQVHLKRVGGKWQVTTPPEPSGSE